MAQRTPTPSPDVQVPPQPLPQPGIYRERLEVRRLGVKRHLLDDAYHLVLVTPWWKLLLGLFVVFIVANLGFAGGYWLIGGVHGATTYWDLFFFSSETFSTIGYGNMVPESTGANLLMTVEAYVGLLVNAFAAGIVVAKFARPTARVLFSRVMVLSPFDGTPTLMVRMANSRNNQVFDARIGLFLLRDVTTQEGHLMRRVLDLPVVRERVPFLTLTHMAMHRIDAASPLHGLTREELQRVRCQFILTVQGVDETFMAQVHARAFYNLEDVIWDGRFADVLSRDTAGRVLVDYTRFDDVVPLTAPGRSPLE